MKFFKIKPYINEKEIKLLAYALGRLVTDEIKSDCLKDDEWREQSWHMINLLNKIGNFTESKDKDGVLHLERPKL